MICRISGTSIPIYLIQVLLDEGLSIQDIIEDFHLTEEQIQEVLNKGNCGYRIK